MFSTLLLSWYDAHGRVLPFRGTKDPYRVWVSEIMLQQTRTETVGAYYERFLRRFPDVGSLAAAPEQDVLKCWEGLGYYSRARNLLKAARKIVDDCGGVFPADPEKLRALPGVGDYTAAAVASIAFDLPHPAMDGNLTRVLSRFHGVREDVSVPSVKRRLLSLAREDMPAARCGDFNQALMDLGATVCTPGTPDCESCPLASLCDARRAGDAEDLPVKSAAKPPLEIPMAVAVVCRQGRVLVTQRKEALLRGLWVYALAENGNTAKDAEKALKALGVRAVYQGELGAARHVFTHRVWQMKLYRFAAETPVCREGRFVTLREMRALPMPTAMRAAREAAAALLTPQTLPCRAEELPALAAAYAESWRESHASLCSPAFVARHDQKTMESRLKDHLSAGRRVFGLWIAGEAAGVLVTDPKENALTALYVHPCFQGLGAGRAAASFAVEALDKTRNMVLTVRSDNEKALRLYESLGFTRVISAKALSAGVMEETRLRPGGQIR